MTKIKAGKYVVGKHESTMWLGDDAHRGNVSLGATQLIKATSGKFSSTVAVTGITTLNSTLVLDTYDGAAAGAGIDAASPTIKVGSVNGIVTTRIFIDIGGGSIVSSGDANDTIGEEGVTGTYLTRLTTAVNGMVYAGQMTCLEVPLTGDPDINLNADSSATVAEDVGGMDHVLINASGAAWTLGESENITVPSGGIVDDYIYLTHGGTTEETYSAGKFLIVFEGYVV